MNKEKQIREIFEIIKGGCGNQSCGDCKSYNEKNCSSHLRATTIYNAGYRKQSEIVRCKDCKHRSEEGFCHIDIEGVGYKKTHEDGFCDKGERK